MGWKFKNEAFLEDFIWDNLESFFELIPLGRQYKTKNSQICDIVAKNKYNQLVILELKIRMIDILFSRLPDTMTNF